MALRSSTTIDRFGPALLAALAARPLLSNVELTDGIPPPGTFGGPEWIAVLDVEFEQESRGLNVTTRPRVENYRQRVMISVVRPGREGQAAANERAWDLFFELEQAYRDNVYLDGFFAGDGQIVHVQTERGSFQKRATDTDREATIEVDLVVKARI